MTVLAGDHRPVGRASRRPVVLTSVVIGGALVLLGLAVVTGSNLRLAAVPLALLVFVVAAHERLFAWRSLVALIILTILIVPIRRYTLPSALPFQLELYRIVVFFVAVLWLTSLLIDPRVRLRRSGMEGPLGAFAIAILLSIVFNLPRVEAAGTVFAKSMTFFLSFFVVFYAIVSLIRRPREIDFLVRILAGGGGVLGLLAVIESRTGFNAFNHLKTVLPFLEYDGSQLNASDISRGGRLRVFGSAQHPIAFGAAFAVLLPLAVYCARTSGRKRWWIGAGLIVFGAFATQSRTAVLMLFTMGICFLVLYRKAALRLWPYVLPALAVIHVILPGTLGTIKDSFTPQGGLIAEQSDAQVGSGRVATLGPVLRAEFLPNPTLGEGFATRITSADTTGITAKAPITDDQWLSLLAQTGFVGVLAFGWVFVRAIRRMGAAAKRDATPRGWLLSATLIGAAAYGVGMFTFDAFSFIQVTFLFFIVLGLGAATLLTSSEEWSGFRRRVALDGRYDTRSGSRPVGPVPAATARGK
jgi:hypothetical protein